MVITISARKAEPRAQKSGNENVFVGRLMDGLGNSLRFRSCMFSCTHMHIHTHTHKTTSQFWDLKSSWRDPTMCTGTSFPKGRRCSKINTRLFRMHRSSTASVWITMAITLGTVSLLVHRFIMIKRWQQALNLAINNTANTNGRSAHGSFVRMRLSLVVWQPSTKDMKMALPHEHSFPSSCNANCETVLPTSLSTFLQFVFTGHLSPLKNELPRPVRKWHKKPVRRETRNTFWLFIPQNEGLYIRKNQYKTGFSQTTLIKPTSIKPEYSECPTVFIGLILSICNRKQRLNLCPSNCSKFSMLLQTDWSSLKRRKMVLLGLVFVDDRLELADLGRSAHHVQNSDVQHHRRAHQPNLPTFWPVRIEQKNSTNFQWQVFVCPTDSNSPWDTECVRQVRTTAMKTRSDHCSIPTHLCQCGVLELGVPLWNCVCWVGGGNTVRLVSRHICTFRQICAPPEMSSADTRKNTATLTWFCRRTRRTATQLSVWLWSHWCAHLSLHRKQHCNFKTSWEATNKTVERQNRVVWKWKAITSTPWWKTYPLDDHEDAWWLVLCWYSCKNKQHDVTQRNAPSHIKMSANIHFQVGEGGYASPFPVWSVHCVFLTGLQNTSTCIWFCQLQRTEMAKWNKWRNVILQKAKSIWNDNQQKAARWLFWSCEFRMAKITYEKRHGMIFNSLSQRRT